MGDLIGQTLGNYRIEERLGTGGMGEVFRGVHVRLNRPAAVKVMHPHLATDSTFQARFLREARAAASLSHPHIVEVYDFGEQDGRAYLVMELVPDGSLRTLLRQRGSGSGWPLAVGLELIGQAAEGLAYAQARGMVHRDIKPDNLLLARLDGGEPDGTAEERYDVKISDFGLARLAEAGGELTVTGMVVGTPAYMSPEQCQGGTLDGRSDLYSLGVVLYQVATGTLPFRVKSLSEAVFKHLSAEPPAPRTIRPDLPIALERVIVRCLAKRPEERYTTGLELARALRSALGDSELSTLITAPTPEPSSAPSAPPISPVHTPAAEPGPAASVAPATPPAVPNRLRTPEPVIVPAEADAPTVADEEPPPLAADAARRTFPPDAVPRPPRAGVAARPPQRSGPPRRWIYGGAGASLLVLTALVVLLVIAGRSTPTQPAAAARPAHTATATVRPTATPVERVQFADALTANNGKWFVSSRCCSYADGGYEIRGGWISFAPVGRMGDATISARTRYLGGPSDQFYGIILRAANASSYYWFAIDGNGRWTFSLVTNGNGAPIVRATENAAIARGAGASNVLTVRARGSHFVFYVNDAQVGQADDTSLSAGTAALTNAAGNLAVVYNDFKVTVPS